MNIVIRARSAAEISPEVKAYATRKLERLSRHHDGILDAKLDFNSDRRRVAEAVRVVQLTIHVGRNILKASESAPDEHAAVDLVVDKMDRQLLRHKEKRDSRSRRTGLGVASANSQTQEELTA